VIDALFPFRCLVCGRFFDAPDIPRRQKQPHGIRAEINIPFGAIIEQLFSSYLCAGCVQGIIPVAAPICVTCGSMFKSRVGEDRLCGDCITSLKRFRIARAPVVYDQALMSLIHSFKYNGKVQLAKPLGGLLLHTFQRYWDAEGIDVVIPVPLYGSRLKQRGFNQAVLLIQHWRKTALEFAIDVAGLQIERSILVRKRSTVPQTGLGRNQRMANMKNAFHVHEAERIRGRRILLVDDVYTTGATVNECARELLDKGAQHVDVLTVARAM
jgi:ComF family protein